MSNPLSERELLKIQIQTYEFYARLIDRAVGGGSSPVMPRWDEQRATEYSQLAEQLRKRLAELDASQNGTVSNGAGVDGQVSARTLS